MVDDSETKGTVAKAPAGAPTADGNAPTYAATDADSQATTGEATIIPTWGAGEGVALPDPGYQLGELIGRGGMGEVVAANDQRIGREVAVKRIRSRQPSPDAVTRFLREARIQARLDHPSIVPVYELGTEADGRPYFTMKRLAGDTLAKRLSENVPIQRLLRAFIGVCQAIGLAHARGVVHRDLKPSNIMLGEFGEVYVLDWGVARVLTDRRRQTHPGIALDVDDGTTAGAILGTPGYMSPEQVRGQEVGTAADVYALGAILFEILTGESLHPRGEAALATTLTQPQEAPTKRTSERTIPPELDVLCFEALADDPTARPNARLLGDRVQAYLDGDRDLEGRRALAAEQLAGAREALASDDKHGRSTAMRRAARALALDPQSVESAQLLTSLVLEPPKELPAELVASLVEEDRAFSVSRQRQAMWAYLALFVLLPLFPFLDVTNWTAVAGIYGFLLVGALISRRQSELGRTSVPTTLILTTISMLLFTRVAGPFIFTPIVACSILMFISLIPAFAQSRAAVVAWVVVTVMLPLVLEWTGLLHSTYDVSDGALHITSDIVGLRSKVDEFGLVLGNLAFIIAAGMVAVSLSRKRRDAQRQLHIQAWHLKQLLPTESRPWGTRSR